MLVTFWTVVAGLAISIYALNTIKVMHILENRRVKGAFWWGITWPFIFTVITIRGSWK
jgi:hypothetical protein